MAPASTYSAASRDRSIARRVGLPESKPGRSKWEVGSTALEVAGRARAAEAVAGRPVSPSLPVGASTDPNGSGPNDRCAHGEGWGHWAPNSRGARRCQGRHHTYGLAGTPSSTSGTSGAAPPAPEEAAGTAGNSTRPPRSGRVIGGSFFTLTTSLSRQPSPHAAHEAFHGLAAFLADDFFDDFAEAKALAIALRSEFPRIVGANRGEAARLCTSATTAVSELAVLGGYSCCPARGIIFCEQPIRRQQHTRHTLQPYTAHS
eukprot:scaffold36987_cov58-Phaeocystis_antarctica.AAC.2